MGTSSARQTPKASSPEWSRAQRASKKAVKDRSRDSAQTALLEFAKARKGLTASKGHVKMPPSDLAKLLDILLAFLQAVDHKGLPKALEDAGLKIAEQAIGVAVSALLEKLLEDWPPLAREVLRAAILGALEPWLDPKKKGKPAGILDAAAGAGNAINEVLARLLARLYLQDMREYLSRDKQDNAEQSDLDKNILEAAREVVAEHIFPLQDELDDADWGSEVTQELLEELLRKLDKKLGGK